jgi:leader peptidase (prepilin peptidase)/N-methyltransferase
MLTPCPVYRLSVPLGVPPRSQCPHCDSALPSGWRGWACPLSRCHNCRTTLVRHPWVYVAVSVAAFATLAWRLPTHHASDRMLAAAWLLLAAVAILLAGIDVRVNRLPLPIVAGSGTAITILVATAALINRSPGALGRAAATAGAFVIVYLILALLGPGLVGAGDIYLSALLGLLLGTGPLLLILAGALLPYLLAAPITAIRLAAGRLAPGDRVALGPYLLAGAIIAKVLIP